MRERSSAAVVACVDAGEIEVVLWAACEGECIAAGDAVVSLISFSVANRVSSDLDLPDARARDAAVALVASASLVKDLAGAFSSFTLRERRSPSAHELVHEAAGRNATLVTNAHALALCFLAQRCRASGNRPLFRQ